MFFSAFDSNNKFGTFSGNNLEATLSIGEQEYASGKRTFITSINPVIDVQPKVASGTISITGTTINGTGTAFTTQLSVGDVIRVNDVSSQYNNAKFIVSLN